MDPERGRLMQGKRQKNNGVRKVCGCKPIRWCKCKHAWNMNFRHRGVHHRLSLDRELGRHIEGKTEAGIEAGNLRNAIRAGTFRSRADRSAPTGVDPAPTTADAITLTAFATTYFERRGKPATPSDRSCLNRLTAF